MVPRLDLAIRLGPPLWIPYLAMPVGFGLFLLRLATDLLAVISGLDEPFPESGH